MYIYIISGLVSSHRSASQRTTSPPVEMNERGLKTSVCMYVCTYRLVDLLGALDGLLQPARVLVVEQLSLYGDAPTVDDGR